VRKPIDVGSTPVKRLELSPKYLRLVMYPMELGIDPVKLLVANFSDCRAVR
jgi:hypothetical protein